MDATKSGIHIKIMVGVVVGLLLSAIDNFAAGGEVSPVVIILLLLGAMVTCGILWGWKGWIACLATWVWLPMVHLIKHILDLPDTIHPNTIKSIFLLAAFTFVVSTVGVTIGALLKRLNQGNRI